MWLWAFVGTLGFFDFTALWVYKVMTLSLTFNAIGIVKACIEPLWAVWSTHLVSEHVTGLFIECGSILFSIEILVTTTPISPAPCETMEYLAAIRLSSYGRDTGTAKIFLRDDIGRYLTPRIRNNDTD